MSSATGLHAGFTVADLRATVSFLEQVLGFKVTSPRRPPEGAIASVTGVAGAVVDVAYVDACGLTLELLQYLEPGSASLAGGRPCDIGAAHLAVEVESVKETIAKAAEYGFRPAREEPAVVLGGPSEGLLATYIFDAHGFTIELMGG